jgi:nucleoside-diphosphate-sugar epimerase
VCVDMTSDASVEAGFARLRYAYGDRIDLVVHLAAHYDFSGEPSPLYEGLTVRGTGRLLQALQKFQVGRFVFSSTMQVNPPSKPGERITEDSPLEPKWDYPSLRIAGVYDDRCHSIPIAHQIQRILIVARAIT